MSGPKACRGSTKEVRIFPHFLHSAGVCQPSVRYKVGKLEGQGERTGHRRRQRIVDPHWHLVTSIKRISSDYILEKSAV